ncbi:hypothetical protein QVA66_06080 [Staphylococcus chromogenes]|nr:hypothetical protein [Staphylococcus chromogenes]
MWRTWFVILSWLGVGLAALELVFGVVSLLLTGFVNVGGSVLFTLLVVNPILIGVPLAAVMAVWSLILLAMRRAELSGLVRICVGHLVTLALATAEATWAFTAPNRTGWELMFLPVAVIIGQCVVAAGLASKTIRGNRSAV